jgi:hypothetical protein
MSSAKFWRAIHLLPVLSKTLELIVLGRVMDNHDHQLSPTQLASWCSRGSSDLVVALQTRRTEAKADGLKVSLVSADVAGGFDRVDALTLATGDIFPVEYRRWLLFWAGNRSAQY